MIEYPIAKGSGIFSSITIRRFQDDKAYDPEILQDMEIPHGYYVTHGAKSTPAEVRVHTAAPSFSNPTAAPVMPRRIRFRLEDIGSRIHHWVSRWRVDPVELQRQEGAQ